MKLIHFIAFFVLPLSAQSFPLEIELSELNGENGFIVNGVDSGDYLGNSVSGAGDVNGDGLDDFVIAAYQANPDGLNETGASYVVFGNPNGHTHPFDLSNLNGTNGFRITGANDADQAGYTVSEAGDINGDGIDDIIIGAPDADPDGNDRAGISYVIFGRTAGYPSSLKLSAVNGINGFAVYGVSLFDILGRSVSYAGDINDDGMDDILISATSADPNNISGAGVTYVIFGGQNGFNHPFDLSSLDGTKGFSINGANEHDNFGGSVSYAGDVNADGIDDIIIGAAFADPDGNDKAGKSYVIFGNSNGFGADIEVSSISGDNGFVVNGLSEDHKLGSSVSHAGDVNGDGIDDIIIAAQGSSSASGPNTSYVIFGSAGGFDSPFYPSALNGTNGFVVNGIDNLGWSLNGTGVSKAGDVNGDGIDDIIIGAPFDNTIANSVGTSFVVFGRLAGFPSAINLTTLTPDDGFVIKGIEVFDMAGSSVNTAGDVNGDGLDDIIIGAPEGNTNAEGQSYIIYGDDIIFSNDFELIRPN